MPDWSYQTIFRPLLFRIPARAARGFTLQAMGRLSRIPGGTFIIKTLGHVEPSPLLQRNFAGILLPTPVGLSGAIDKEGIAVKAISQFGFGFVEIGPITSSPIKSDSPIRIDPASESILYPCEYENLGAEAALHRIRHPKHRLPQFVRVAAASPEAGPNEAAVELQSLAERFMAEPNVSALIIEAMNTYRDDSKSAKLLLEQMSSHLVENASITEKKPLLLYIPLDMPDSVLKEIAQAADPAVWSGFVIGDSIRTADGAVLTGHDGRQACMTKLQTIRAYASGSPVLFASAGVHEPADALTLIAAGADYLLLHSGLVYAGPGLPKRVNEAILYDRLARGEPPPTPSFWTHWGWMCLLGVSMMLGGVIAWLIAASSVLLPYDESFLDMARSQVAAINGNLLHFMSHDRITLAGTMLSIGILYYQLARHGLRYGLHWAKTTIWVSCGVGFPSFFLYLGYGFLDPLHAAAAILLLPMFLLAMRRNPDRPNHKPVNLHNSKVWRRGLWGQLCFIVVGASLCIGGIVIAYVGITDVFVPQDIGYLCTTRDALDLANSRLVPLIAHDRAGFGGALLSDAIGILIVALWGLQQGARWQWWTLLWSGSPGFIAGLSVHFAIGYTDFVHLLPAYFVLVVYIAGLILLYPYLMLKERDC
ncbi:dihydroorotate dehydrogenase [Paenibacillus cellulosilyticus]|uniref:Dihydroorotate dehydrogenase n=1 Tax=Paenibacillus cellulosilyticus TaxID=375489 RepID=A0A2V2YW63_9BACL|nr:hypothetical protein [Paenibacillus cellulosilyticus]PWW05211.1 dihydroorotate dehydrogenase [Paenibacillus cellulosilyticus]QKS43535.1 hypothetical protein HUB94_03115 [Paenibacillus cellulosilyticus]